MKVCLKNSIKNNVQANIKLVQEDFKLELSDRFLNSVKFQIQYYGFEKVEQKNEYIGLKKNIKINNVINYLEENHIKVKLCEETKKYIKKIQTEKIFFLEKIEKLKKIKENIPKENLKKFSDSLKFLKRNLKEYQLTSCYHLFCSESAANFSVPGSGKTSVVLAYYEKLKIENKVDGILLIGPKNCFYSWNTEFLETLGRNPKLSILGKDIKLSERIHIYKNSLKSEIYAFHFMTVSRDIEYLKDFASKNRFLLVIDEAHNIKKEGGNWAKAALELGKLSKFKVILTGTPRPNQHRDFYNYLDFLYGKNKILSKNDKAKIEVLVKRNNLKDADKILKENIKPFYVRVTKKDLCLSKPNFNLPTLIQMNPIEKKIHDEIFSKMQNFSLKKYKKNIDIIEKIKKARMIRLRQNCSYVKNLLKVIPYEIKDGDENLIDEENMIDLIKSYDRQEKPAKIYYLKSLVLPLVRNNKKAIVWSTHLKTIDLIKKELLNEGVNAKVITGKTELDIRENIKDEFNDKNSNLDVIVALPKACSESISLHKACQNAIYYDQDYNTAEFLQSLDRIHRVGGSEENPVYYDFLQYRNTIDEKIYKRVFEKANMQMKVIEEDNLIFDINQEDNSASLYEDLKI